MVLGLMEGGVTCSTYMQNAKPLDSFEQVTLANNNGVMAGEYLPDGTDLAAITDRYPFSSAPHTDGDVSVTEYQKTGTPGSK